MCYYNCYHQWSNWIYWWAVSPLIIFFYRCCHDKITWIFSTFFKYFIELSLGILHGILFILTLFIIRVKMLEFCKVLYFYLSLLIICLVILENTSYLRGMYPEKNVSLWYKWLNQQILYDFSSIDCIKNQFFSEYWAQELAIKGF